MSVYIICQGRCGTSSLLNFLRGGNGTNERVNIKVAWALLLLFTKLHISVVKGLKKNSARSKKLQNLHSLQFFGLGMIYLGF